MRIAQILPTTLIDYPGKVASLIYTASCNFRCPFCHNPELVLERQIAKLRLIPEEEVFSLLSERGSFLDGVVITGGEPTLQPDLARFIRRVRELGFLMKLDTNGSRPEVIDELLDSQLLDYVAMDVKGPEPRYSEMAGVPVDMGAIVHSIRSIIGRAPDYEFRTTVAPSLTTEEIERIVPLISGAKRYYLQRFIVPEDKDLLDPDWSGRTGLSEEELLTIWDRIGNNFASGGVR